MPLVADSSAQVSLQRPASNVKSPGQGPRPGPRGPTAGGVKRRQADKCPAWQTEFREHLLHPYPRWPVGLPLWTLAVLTPAGAGASSSLCI